MQSSWWSRYLCLALLVSASLLALPETPAEAIYVCVGLSSAIAIAGGVRLHRPVRPVAGC